MNAILVIMLLTFFAILLGVGVYSRRHASDVNGFVLGGRSVGPWLTGLVSDLTQKNESLLAWGQSVGWSAETLGLRVGLLSATVFPLLLLICTLLLARKPKENR